MNLFRKTRFVAIFKTHRCFIECFETIEELEWFVSKGCYRREEILIVLDIRMMKVVKLYNFVETTNS